MPDALMKPYDLPDLDRAVRDRQAHGITLRRAPPSDKGRVRKWVAHHWRGVKRGWDMCAHLAATVQVRQ